MPILYAAYDAPNTGDYNNAVALYNGLDMKDVTKAGLVQNSELGKVFNAAATTPEESYHIILVGDAGAKAVEQLSVPQNVQLFWSGHQRSPALKHAVESGKINTVSIARSGISRAETIHFARHAQVHLVPGVPVEMKEDVVHASYLQHQEQLLAQEDKRRIVLILGGDAPDLEGNRGYIPPEEGRQIGVMLAALAKQHNAVVAIINNPRTGEYDPLTGQETLAHHNWHPDTGETLEQNYDKTTQALCALLEEETVPFQIYDFRWGTQKLRTEAAKTAVGSSHPVTSMYDPVMGLILSDPNAMVLYTGESITEGNKCAKYLLGRQTYAITVASMHEGHEDFTQELHERGYIGRIDLKKQQILEPIQKATTPLNITATALQALERMLAPGKQMER